jgi:flagellar biosynthesis/type III secretory pathway protein FliH
MSRSLTYAEIAEALRITPESANRLARRKRWPRMKGNDGRTRVAVPEEALVRPDSPPANPGDSPSDSPPAASPDNPVHAQIARLDRELAHAQIARMEGELAGMREALAEARARASAAGARAEAAEARASEESAKTARAIAAFDQLAQRLEAMAEARRPSWWSWLRFGFLE